jgi:hypothetical protein
MRKPRIALILAASTACFISHRATNGYGVLRLTIVDGSTNSIVPARIALRDGSGEYFVPDSALAIFGDCGKVPFHNWAPASATLQTKWGEHRGVRDPYRGSTDFYTTGTLATPLHPGHYWMRVEKGPEYGAAEQEFVITAGKEQSIRSVLRRWIDLPAEGWYSSDDHLHIPRPSAHFDPVLATWMQAEDIHVANLLQMGLARDVHLTPQRAFGPASVYESSQTLLVGGQENPRTHILGHSIILGGRNWIDLTVDRPKAAWVKLKLQCFDRDGRELWEERAQKTNWVSSDFHPAVENLKRAIARRLAEAPLPLATTRARN